MKDRTQARVWSKHIIYDKKARKDIGFICMVSYLRGKTTPHLEYSLEEEYHGQGIMSRELPLYLKRCKKYGNYQLIAVANKDNHASIRLLEKNGFIKVKPIDDNIAYVIDLRITADIIEKEVRKVKGTFTYHN